MFRKDEVDGKIVIEANGKAFGKAKDIAFGLDGTVALIVLTNDNTEAQITMDRVMGVADYIVIRRDRPEPKVAPPPTPVKKPVVVAPAPVMAAPPPPMAPAATSCRSCGAPLKPGAKFCTKCGTPA
jgi:sporulation protein YlmC with PRC-barrel domain